MKELNYILILGIIFICGCVGTRAMDVHIIGNNIRSPYGSGDADIHYTSNTTWGYCHGNSETK